MFTDLSGQVLLGPPQSLLQLGNVLPGLLQVAVALGTEDADVLPQSYFLQGREEEEEKIIGWLDSEGAEILKVCSYAIPNLPDESVQVPIESLDEAQHV